MRLDSLLAGKPRTLSFEFFPPKNERSQLTFEDTVDELAPLGPDFVSVTYGAGGSTRGKTREIIEFIAKRSGVTTMAHLTCVNATRDELKGLFDEYAAAGIENLLALRGDPPKGQTRFTPTDGGCAYARDLIELIRADGRFAVMCASFPEKHPDAVSREADWENLSRKFAAGASAAITQCFFTAKPWLEQRAWFAARGEKHRIIPGILPVVNWGALTRFCAMCGAHVPEELRAQIEPIAHDAKLVRKVGMAWTIAMCRELLAAGAPGLHIYCLNRSTAAAEIVTSLRTVGALA